MADKKLPTGFTPGLLPDQFQKLLGANPDILGYKLEPYTDAAGNQFQRVTIANPNGSTQTFGAPLNVGPNNNVSYGQAVYANPTPTATQTGASLADYYAKLAADEKAAAATSARQSAWNLLYNEFNKYGLGVLANEVKGLITDASVDPSEFAIRIQNTDTYKKRFAANQDRIAKGLSALTPAQYINLEDQYQEIMRRYGLPASYYTKGDLGIQAGFNKLIANDVSATELEDRVMTAQNRLINTDVNTLNALRQFYPNITSGDLLAYTLDPDNAIGDIKRKAAAAEIGGAALGAGLLTDVNTAEGLAKYGITKAQAQQGYQTIGEFLPTATALADIYKAQGLGPYTQATAESEVFGTQGSADAAKKRKKLSQLEQASFSGSAGTASSALNRDKASAYQGFVSPGAGSF